MEQKKILGSAVHEPATALLFGLGLSGLFAAVRRAGRH